MNLRFLLFVLEISILGGTGKTPLCALKYFQFLKDLNMNPAFIRKQYSLIFKDETNLQEQVLGPVYQNKQAN